jgi:nucleolar protein 56
MFLITEWFGTFLVDGQGAVQAERLFPKDAKALAPILKRLQEGAVLDEERQLAVRADGDVLVREERQRVLPATKMTTEAPSLADSHDKFGFSSQLLHEAALELGKLGVRQSSSRRDMHASQAIDAIDELNEQANVMVERLREWYALHFPEFITRASRNEEVAALVAAHGTRDAIMAAAPQYTTEDSMGGPLPDLEHEGVRSLARAASHLYATKADLEKYLDNAMPQIAPNVTTLLSPVLAARMLKQAGGIERLARLPAGTIQTLGAEKALFRHIKEGKRPPKHGFLMQHPLVHRAPRYQRGALARSLAAKVALAARADAYTKAEGVGARLAAEFEERATNLREMQQKKKAKAKRGGPPMGRGFEKRGGGGRPGGFGGGGGGGRTYGGGGGYGGRGGGDERPRGGGDERPRGGAGRSAFGGGKPRGGSGGKWGERR